MPELLLLKRILTKLDEVETKLDALQTLVKNRPNVYGEDITSRYFEPNPERENER